MLNKRILLDFAFYLRLGAAVGGNGYSSFNGVLTDRNGGYGGGGGGYGGGYQVIRVSPLTFFFQFYSGKESYLFLCNDIFLQCNRHNLLSQK